jgi:hypothetical protein
MSGTDRGRGGAALAYIEGGVRAFAAHGMNVRFQKSFNEARHFGAIVQDHCPQDT